MMIAVEMHSVTLTYQTGERGLVTALDGVSLSIPVGQILAVFGPSGAGKTSLLRILGCLVTPTAGVVRLNGFDAVRERAKAARQVACATKGAPRARLADATAPILLVDDVDRIGGRRRSWLGDVRAGNRPHTVVFATRDAAFAREVSDRIAVVDRGRLVADVSGGTSADLSHKAYYRIEVQGRLDARRVASFAGLDVRAAREGTTTISGYVADQAALHGVLAKVRDLGLPLLSVTRGGVDIEAFLSGPDGGRIERRD